MLGEAREELAETGFEPFPPTRLYEQVVAEVPCQRKWLCASNRAHFIRERDKRIKKVRERRRVCVEHEAVQTIELQAFRLGPQPPVLAVTSNRHASCQERIVTPQSILPDREVFLLEVEHEWFDFW